MSVLGLLALMVAISAFYPILLAFTLSTDAFSISRDSLDAPLYISGEEARALAKNSGSLRTRDPTLCQSVSINDLQSSLGEALQEIENIATNLWGGDWDTVTTNPPQFSDSPAQACYPADNEFNVIWDTQVNNQSCPISAAQLFGYAANGNSSTMVQIYQGTSVTLETTVSNTVTWTAGLSFTIRFQVEVPMFAITEYYTVWSSIAVSDTHSSTTSTTQDDRTTIQETVACWGPAEFEVYVALSQCTLSGHIDVPVTVDGWVWFFYPNKRDGHWDWAVSLENVDISKRQANMSVEVNGDSSSYGEYVVQCGCTP